MAQQIINVGSAPNDGTGDVLRNSQIKANANFTELYNAVDLKLDKVTTTDVEKVYIKNADGTQGMKPTIDLQNGTLVTNASVSGTYNLDFNKDTYELTLTGNTTLTVSNLPSGKTKVISVYITGNFSLTYPAGFSSRIVGTYDGTKNNLIVIEYRGVTNGYWVQITTVP